jgi:hypothetical protein
MTMTSPSHALACAYISDMLRAAAVRRQVPRRSIRRLVRPAAAR